MDRVDAVLSFVPVDKYICLVYLKEIQLKQAKDRDMRQKINTNQSNFQKTVVDQVTIVSHKNRIYVPQDLRTRIMKWYHHYLCHPEEARIHKTYWY